MALGLLIGCTDNSAQSTLEANHRQVGTQVAELRLTATVQAARARTTVDFILTRSSAAATQSQFLEATLIATGFLPEMLSYFRQRQLEARPTATLTPTPDAFASPQSDRSSDDNVLFQLDESPTPTLPAVSPFAPNVPARPTQTLVNNITSNNLQNPVTATGVGNDDCAIGVTSQFSTGSAEIYIVAEAVDVGNGDVIEARWFRDAEAIGPVYSFAPDFEIERACIWFFVDPSDFEFIAGQYSVDLLLNGEPAISPVPFSIGQ